MRFIVFLLLTAGLFEVGIGLEQWMDNAVAGFPWYLIRGSFYNPGPCGGFMAIILPFALFVILNVRTKGNRGISCILRTALLSVAWINFIGIIVLLPLTQSRSAWIAALTGTCFVAGKHYCFRDRLIRLYTNNRQLVLAVCSGILLVSMMAAAGIYRLKKDSADGRWLIWKVWLFVFVSAG